MMFDLPEPFGPTTQVIPGSKRSVVAEAKDLNPFKVSALSYIDPNLLQLWLSAHLP